MTNPESPKSDTPVWKQKLISFCNYRIGGLHPDERQSWMMFAEDARATLLHIYDIERRLNQALAERDKAVSKNDAILNLMDTQARWGDECVRAGQYISLNRLKDILFPDWRSTKRK